jgi:hypothetical protein
MTYTGKDIIIGIILIGMVVAGLSIFVSDTASYYNITTNSTYASVYSEASEMIKNQSSLVYRVQSLVQGEGGVVGTIIEGIVAIPSVLWTVFNYIITTPVKLTTTLLADIIGLIGIGETGAEWIAIGIEAIIVISIVWVFIRARFRYDV